MYRADRVKMMNKIIITGGTNGKEKLCRNEYSGSMVVSYNKVKYS
jgi:hypothetical protein